MAAPTYNPYKARYQQNAGLAAGVNEIAAQNQAIAQRGPTPYQPSLGDPNVTGPGAYAMSGLAGRMSNYGAQQNYAQTGYMPNRTVGGLYGMTGRDPLGRNRLSDQQVMQAATGNQYAPMGAAANANPGGRFYQGANAGMVAYSGGLRPGFVGPPAQDAAGIDGAQAAFAGKYGLYYNPRTGQMGGSPSVMEMNAHAAGLAGVTGRGPNQKENLNPGGREAYNQGLLARQAAARTQTLNRVAMRSGGLMGGAPGQPNETDQFAGLAQLGTHLGGLVQAGVLQPDQAQQIMQQRMGASGLKIPASRENPVAIKARQQLSPDKMQQFAQLKTGPERDAFLNANGITDPVVRNHLHQQFSVGQTQTPGFFGGLYQGAIDWMAGDKNSPKYSRPTKRPGAGGLVPQTYPPIAPTVPINPAANPYGAYHP